MKDFWNQRFADETFAYGKAPNAFYKDKLSEYELRGNILLPAEGEGRNAVYAALQGLQVTAFDISEEGKNKAKKLARELGVNIDYVVGDFPDLDLTTKRFNVIALIFAHFPPPILHAYHRRLVELLKPGGHIILEGFSKTHLEYQAKNPHVGGPKNIEMLFSIDSIKADFAGLEILELEEIEALLSEGKFHQGLSRVVRFVGRKPI